MENFSDLITRRRSMRKFTDEKVTSEQVKILMKAALMSPSSKGAHPWQFVAVDDKDMLQKLSECKDNGAQLIAGAPLVIVVMADPDVSDVWIEDASIASLMIQLQAEDLGLGSCWVQVRNRQIAEGISADEIVHNLLNIPSSQKVLSIIAIGHKGMERKPFDESHLLWDKVHLNKFGDK